MYPIWRQTERRSVLPAIEKMNALRGPNQAGEATEQRGLTGSIVAENCVEPPRGELCVHAAQSGEAAELLDKIADGNDGRSLRARGITHNRGQ